MTDLAASLSRESRDGSFVSVCRLGEFYIVNYCRSASELSAPQNTFVSRNEALTFAQNLLAQHPEAGFEAPCCLMP